LIFNKFTSLLLLYYTVYLLHMETNHINQDSLLHWLSVKYINISVSYSTIVSSISLCVCMYGYQHFGGRCVALQVVISILEECIISIFRKIYFPKFDVINIW
jgi:hypothetical protein